MGVRGQSGNVIILLMGGMFLLGLAGGAFFLLRPSTLSENEKAAIEIRAAYDEAVASLEKALKDPQSIDGSLERNACFQCLFSADGNCQNQGGTFLLYDKDQSSRPLSQLANDAGIDRFGAICRGFPSRDCPLRVETAWEPVCAGQLCESTTSMRVKAKVVLSPTIGHESALEWKKENLFTPQIQLSQAAQCIRGGGEWGATQCLTPSQQADRRIASPDGSNNEEMAEAGAEMQGGSPGAEPHAAYKCIDQVVVQGLSYPVQYLSADRAQVSVPAMSCQQPGYQDVFIFQCSAKNPPTFPDEGQWIQVEAVMAPPCDPNGNGMGQGAMPTRF